MIQNQSLAARFQELTDSERMFRELYFAKKEPDQLRRYLASLPQERQKPVRDWLQAEKGVILSELTENLAEFDFSDNVIVTRHARYTPAFVHKHTFFEIVCVLEGNCVNRIGDMCLSMSDGDLCMISPGVYHALQETEGSHIFNILIKHYSLMETLSNFLLQKNALAGFFIQSLYMKSAKHYLSFHTKGDREIQHLLEALILEEVSAEERSQDEQHSALKEAYLNALLNLLARSHTEAAECEGISVANSRLIFEIKKYLTSNLQTATLQSLAEHFNYSPSYLSRLIQQSAGTNFSKILRRIKINKACSLLSNTDLNVNEIGEQTGYRCQRQFNRAFQDVIHMTPSEYRKQHRLLLL